jgi:hypothetical protein
MLHNRTDLCPSLLECKSVITGLYGVTGMTIAANDMFHIDYMAGGNGGKSW